MSTDLHLTPAALVVERPTGPSVPPPMPDPDPTHVRASALVLLGSLPAGYLGYRAHPEYLEITVTAVFVAIVLFLICVGRYDLDRPQ